MGDVPVAPPRKVPPRMDHTLSDEDMAAYLRERARAEEYLARLEKELLTPFEEQKRKKEEARRRKYEARRKKGHLQTREYSPRSPTRFYEKETREKGDTQAKKSPHGSKKSPARSKRSPNKSPKSSPDRRASPVIKRRSPVKIKGSPMHWNLSSKSSVRPSSQCIKQKMPMMTRNAPIAVRGSPMHWLLSSKSSVKPESLTEEMDISSMINKSISMQHALSKQLRSISKSPVRSKTTRSSKSIKASKSPVHCSNKKSSMHHRASKSPCCQGSNKKSSMYQRASKSPSGQSSNKKLSKHHSASKSPTGQGSNKKLSKLRSASKAPFGQGSNKRLSKHRSASKSPGQGSNKRLSKHRSASKLPSGLNKKSSIQHRQSRIQRQPIYRPLLKPKASHNSKTLFWSKHSDYQPSFMTMTISQLHQSLIQYQVLSRSPERSRSRRSKSPPVLSETPTVTIKTPIYCNKSPIQRQPMYRPHFRPKMSHNSKSIYWSQFSQTGLTKSAMTGKQSSIYHRDSAIVRASTYGHLARSKRSAISKSLLYSKLSPYRKSPMMGKQSSIYYHELPSQWQISRSFLQSITSLSTYQKALKLAGKSRSYGRESSMKQHHGLIALPISHQSTSLRARSTSNRFALPTSRYGSTKSIKSKTPPISHTHKSMSRSKRSASQKKSPTILRFTLPTSIHSSASSFKSKSSPIGHRKSKTKSVTPSIDRHESPMQSRKSSIGSKKSPTTLRFALPMALQGSSESLIRSKTSPNSHRKQSKSKTSSFILQESLTKSRKPSLSREKSRKSLVDHKSSPIKVRTSQIVQRSSLRLTPSVPASKVSKKKLSRTRKEERHRKVKTATSSFSFLGLPEKVRLSILEYQQKKLDKMKRQLEKDEMKLNSQYSSSDSFRRSLHWKNLIKKKDVKSPTKPTEKDAKSPSKPTEKDVKSPKSPNIPTAPPSTRNTKGSPSKQTISGKKGSNKKSSEKKLSEKKSSEEKLSEKKLSEKKSVEKKDSKDSASRKSEPVDPRENMKCPKAFIPKIKPPEPKETARKTKKRSLKSMISKSKSESGKSKSRRDTKSRREKSTSQTDSAPTSSEKSMSDKYKSLRESKSDRSKTIRKRTADKSTSAGESTDKSRSTDKYGSDKSRSTRKQKSGTSGSDWAPSGSDKLKSRAKTDKTEPKTESMTESKTAASTESKTKSKSEKLGEPEAKVEEMSAGEYEEEMHERRKYLEKIRKKAMKLLEKPVQQEKRINRKLMVSDIDLDDLSVLDPEQYEKGNNKTKRTPEDFLLDREIDMAPCYAGMFRDGIRKTDFVVVMSMEGDDLSIDEMKINFLSNLCKIGFDVEFETGILPRHNNLLFAKLHLKDEVMIEHMPHFEVRRRFQGVHINYVGKQGMEPTRWDFFRPVHEREILKIVRRRYFKPAELSGRDRSYIAWMLIEHMPFGIRDFYYGFHRLLRVRAIVDGYALHDGPFFITEEQDIVNFNTRQALFYYWASYKFMYKTQPLHLINEYFGPKIGLYFAFYQYYITMLLIMAGLSVVMLLPSMKQISWLIKGTNSNLYCEGDKLEVKWLCPPCLVLKHCAFRNLTDYCGIHKFVRIAQKYMSMSPIFSTWCILFWLFWVRKQNYWTWLWECAPKVRHPIVRPQYIVNFRSAKRSKATGFWEMSSMRMEKIAIFIVNPLLNLVAVLCSLFFTSLSIYSSMMIIRNTGYVIRTTERYWPKIHKYRDYVAFIFVLPSHYVYMVLLESFYHIMSRLMTRLENHRYYKSYERSFAFRLFGCSVLFNMPFIAFFYWIKGRFYQHPTHHYTSRMIIRLGPLKYNISFPFLREFLYLHCPKTINCIDEMVFILFLLMILLFLGQLVRIYLRTFPNCCCWDSTDFSRYDYFKAECPEWEREFKLIPLSEDTVTLWFNHLVTELAIFMLFGNVAPWVSIFMLIWNLFIIRKTAKQLIMKYRRPTIYNARGIGPYGKIIMILALVAPIAHAFTNARQNLYWKQPFDTQNYSLVKEARYKQSIPYQKRVFACHYITKFRFYNPLRERNIGWPHHWHNISSNRTKTVVSYNRFIVEVSQCADIIKYTHFFAILILLLYVYVPRKSPFVAAESYKEDSIIHYADHEEFYLDDSHLPGAEAL